jgi:hypothetical protein
MRSLKVTRNSILPNADRPKVSAGRIRAEVAVTNWARELLILSFTERHEREIKELGPDGTYAWRNGPDGFFD